MDECPDRRVAPGGPGERVLATVLFTDIVDSTATSRNSATTRGRTAAAP
jgi:class 3 adenylate cyclase